MITFRSNGKLLITGEYVVLDGALSFALPTKFGQSLSVQPQRESKIIWKSYDVTEKIWFQDTFHFRNGLIKSENPKSEISKTLINILNATISLNPEFLSNNEGFIIESHLEFPNNWGLGSSSTLINNIAKWAKVDPFKLLQLTFGGSGYDIACANHDSAVTFQLEDAFIKIEEVKFEPSFLQNLYFVHLNKKQNSREGISHYKANKINSQSIITEITDLTKKLIQAKNLKEFEALLNAHEQLISKSIQQEPIKKRLFKDFEGSIKSLGAWGGDFVMVASEKDPTNYFRAKGFETILTYKEMIL